MTDEELEKKLRLVRMKELPPEARERFLRRAAEKLAARRRLSPRPWARPLAVAAAIASLLLLDIWLSAAQSRRMTRLVGGPAALSQRQQPAPASLFAGLNAHRATFTALLESPDNLWR